MANYVLTLALKTELWQEHILEKRLNIARIIYNSCLSEILKRHRKMINSSEYKGISNLDKKEQSKRYKELDKKYLISKFELNKYVKPMTQKFKKNIGSQMGQELAERAFATYEKFKYGKAKKVYFKSYGNFYSVREKGNITGLRFFKEDCCISWLGLKIPVIIKNNDKYTQSCFLDKLLYCRLLKRVVNGKNKYYVQITFEGTPPKKHKVGGENEIGIDIGTSTIAIVSDNKVELKILAENIEINEKEKTRLQRKLDRQRRANNPNKYNADGTINIENKEKWKKSKSYLKTQLKLANIQRKIADKRKQSHNILANSILEIGTIVKVENMSFKGLQRRSKKTEMSEKTGKFKKKKRFGKSLSNRAPALLIEIINRKLEYIGKNIIKIDTFKVKASQLNHSTNEYEKKSLSKRWVEILGNKIQRDLYSAFLIKNVKENLEEVSIEKAQKEFKNFVKLHNEEIERIKKGNVKTLKCMGF
ncbi:RNA-guided endonuclease TnpB family protein [Fusobacterium animalis]|uniref:RNA-guided endonuclease TnpB family protein n=1 Tax=Fusobacterium animalis TaxID=76859 RepID=UPI00324AF328